MRLFRPGGCGRWRGVIAEIGLEAPAYNVGDHAAGRSCKLVPVAIFQRSPEISPMHRALRRIRDLDIVMGLADFATARLCRLSSEGFMCRVSSATAEKSIRRQKGHLSSITRALMLASAQDAWFQGDRRRGGVEQSMRRRGSHSRIDLVEQRVNPVKQ